MRARTIVIAVDSFKGTIGAAAAAGALARGWAAARPGDEIRLLPMADGGEGTLEAFAVAVPGARRMPVTVTGPDDHPVDASWMLLPAADGSGPTGVVELASTSGIELLGPDALRPWDAHTRGFGEAIGAALDHGVTRLVLGIGSSASTDGGTGMLTALGARFLDDRGRPVAPGARGLADIARADLTGLRPLPPGGATVLSDVTHGLLGPTGAAHVFAPQKGAAPDDLPRMDAGLTRLSTVLGGNPDAPGSGAAGGTGYALRVWGADLVPGAGAVADLIGLPAALAAADLVLTGEGSFDGQSAAGKVPTHVGRLATDAATPVALVAGRIADDVTGADLAGFAASVSLTALAGSAAEAMTDPARWLAEAGATLARGAIDATAASAPTVPAPDA
ncbi:glycerate kinase [Microbacterium sp. NPDC077184]|uniref:glycerate kinase n=1 Tax=Microbacterium sp. NPDC077184 TaxID=3154764 RepID=UPI0034246165